MNTLSNINESGIISQLNRHLAGNMERICNIVSIPGVDNKHKFVNKNGDLIERGYIITDSKNDIDLLKELIRELIDIRGNNCDLNDIDVSNIDTFHGIFSDINKDFDGDISGWNTENAVSFATMFLDSNYTGEYGDITKWNVSKVYSFNRMFENSKYNGNLTEWVFLNDAKVFNSMFENSAFTGENGDINAWNKSNMHHHRGDSYYNMFKGCNLKIREPNFERKRNLVCRIFEGISFNKD